MTGPTRPTGSRGRGEDLRRSPGGACCARLDDVRLHFQHGPIDLVVGAHGRPDAVEAAHEQAWREFAGLLPGLVAHLSVLRHELPAGTTPPALSPADPVADRVAMRMVAACWPVRALRVSPMAAVAGSVAAVIRDVYRREGITRAWINNGGDIAIHLGAGERLRIALASPGTAMDAASLPVEIRASDPVRGIASSGWRGRSFSLGIADTVTVLAADAPEADVAATLIANAVDVPDAPVVRSPANTLDPDSDLRDRLVTTAVGVLDDSQRRRALAAGAAVARDFVGRGLIVAARLELQGAAALVPAGAAIAVPFD